MLLPMFVIGGSQITTIKSLLLVNNISQLYFMYLQCYLELLILNDVFGCTPPTQSTRRHVRITVHLKDHYTPLVRQSYYTVFRVQNTKTWCSLNPSKISLDSKDYNPSNIWMNSQKFVKRSFLCIVTLMILNIYRSLPIPKRNKKDKGKSISYLRWKQYRLNENLEEPML